ncbi:efflux RND transporter periplasmic adaptor subunit [Ramlibacter albus]|uniref:Efflux RND transporter periplasmic adaptor subunit n=1 Tax=Ramlibacter albus TaxID=2079448 RepID=A0A923M594_9BURK|nr:efflux RND transporter periplasmic adaptor subunit [Ramlibacter albus]MBC5763074.1 efflux RND transporter periplasmic adaptor subunit [Ramlibacter albus]
MENASAAKPERGVELGNPRRRRGLLLVSALSIFMALGWGAYEWLVARRYESTDNAYVQGNVVQITPQIAGTVLAIYAEETDYVKAGQPLVKLDPADVQIALRQAEANLGVTVRQVQTVYANNAKLAAQVRLRQAEADRARAELQRARDDLARRAPLAANGAISKEELAHAHSQLATAQSAFEAAQASTATAREELASNQALTQGASVEEHPQVEAAAARLREAWIAARRASIPAPVDGYVAKRVVQLGQRVAAGAPLMSVVPLRQVWVEANFKEIQVRKIRIGQPVELTADLYGRRVKFHGKVEGLGVGTGAAFALLPAQNATGNWIKVVQRLPVRIALDPKEVVSNPLRVGLSMQATVNISSAEGKTLADASRAASEAQTPVFANGDDGADEAVRRIVNANRTAPSRARH